MIMSVFYIAFIGLIIAAYAYFVESKIEADPTYKPLCDISGAVSCSKPMRSKYSKIFMFSNGTLGMIYYASMMVLAVFECIYCARLLSVAGVCMSVFFAYILFFKVKSFCLICISLYAVNIALLLALYMYL